MPIGRLVHCLASSVPTHEQFMREQLMSFEPADQGALDVRFLAARFEKGKKAIQDTLDQKHRYWQEGLPTGHAELLSFQSRASSGDLQPHLGMKMDNGKPCVRCCVKISFLVARHTILIMDASLWPYNRAWTAVSMPCRSANMRCQFQVPSCWTRP